MTENRLTVVSPATDPIAALRGWEPVLAPIQYRDRAGELRKAPGHVVHRTDTGDAIGVVGPRYHLIPNAPKVALLDELRDRGVVTDLRAGTFDGGARVWAQCATGQRLDIAGAPVEHRFTVIDYYDGGGRLGVLDTPVNIVCRNTFARASRTGRGSRMRHTRSITWRFEAVIAAIKASCDAFPKMVDDLRALAAAPIGHAEWKGLLDELFPLPAKDGKGEEGEIAESAQKHRNRLSWAYESAPAALPGTRYGAWQAVTYYATHELGRDRGRMESSWTGEGARLAGAAMDYLTRN